MVAFYVKLSCAVTNDTEDTETETMDINVKFRDQDQFNEFEDMSFDVIQHLISEYIFNMREGFHLDDHPEVCSYYKEGEIPEEFLDVSNVE